MRTISKGTCRLGGRWAHRIKIGAIEIWGKFDNKPELDIIVLVAEEHKKRWRNCANRSARKNEQLGAFGGTLASRYPFSSHVSCILSSLGATRVLQTCHLRKIKINLGGNTSHVTCDRANYENKWQSKTPSGNYLIYWFKMTGFMN